MVWMDMMGSGKCGASNRHTFNSIGLSTISKQIGQSKWWCGAITAFCWQKVGGAIAWLQTEKNLSLVYQDYAVFLAFHQHCALVHTVLTMSRPCRIVGLPSLAFFCVMLLHEWQKHWGWIFFINFYFQQISPSVRAGNSAILFSS